MQDRQPASVLDRVLMVDRQHQFHRRSDSRIRTIAATSDGVTAFPHLASEGR